MVLLSITPTCTLPKKDTNEKSRKRKCTIKFNKKSYNLGDFTDEIAAAKAYDKKAAEFFGEFACLNFPPPPPKARAKAQVPEA